MPYSHSGEIGDVWKHFPLCNILRNEHPEKYYETNSAYAEYTLPKNPRKDYGIFHFQHVFDEVQKNNYEYLKIIAMLDTVNTGKYYGSPALAMSVLSADSEYYFYDLEKPALESIEAFAKSKRVKVNTVCADSTSAFMDNGNSFSSDDFIFLDPYWPFDQNDEKNDYLNIFEKLYRSGAKAVLWYGYDTLRQQNAIMSRLGEIASAFQSGHIHTFDIWQDVMTDDDCDVNPGVPGCGLALCRLSEQSIESTNAMMKLVDKSYQNIDFNGTNTSVLSQYRKF